jgi:hypothetical protein
MTERSEVKTKKNIDYSASAVNLKNPPEVEKLLIHHRKLLADLTQLGAEIATHIPAHLTAELESTNRDLQESSKAIHEAIDTFGSYQHLESGAYAIKQRKVSKSYKAEPFEKTYPQYAPAVIVKAVDVAKLTGLIKGGLLDEARLEADGVLTISETYAYVIR